MKKINAAAVAVLVVFLFPSLQAMAQDKPSFEERNKDKPAIFLLDDVSIKLNQDGSFVKKDHKVIKILKEEGKELGEMIIPYEQGRQVVSGINVFTITPNEKKYPASKVQDMKALMDYPMYSDGHVKVVTQPEVNIGSILDREYVVTSRSGQIKGQFWYAGDNDPQIPVSDYRLTITVPRKLEIRYQEFNMTRKPEITEKNGDIIYSWKAREIGEDVPRDEELAPSPRIEDFKEGFEFSSIKSWEDVSKWYSSQSDARVKLTSEIQAAAIKAAEGKESVRDKTRAILEYVEDNFRYVSMSFGKNALVPHGTNEVFNNKYGDCKDLSLLTRVMLKVVGVNARLALFVNEFSTNDPADDLPIPVIFDHVLLFVEDEAEGNFFADPLLKGFNINEYPMSYQAGYVLLIDEDGGWLGRFPVFNDKNNTDMFKRVYTIHEDGSAEDIVETVFKLEGSIEMREKFKAMDDKGKKDFDAMFESMVASNGEVLEKGLNGLEARYGLVSGHSWAMQKDLFPAVNGMIVIDLPVYGRPGSDFTSKEARRKPVFFPANTRNERVVTYKLPPGYSFFTIPGDIDFDNGFSRIRRNYINSDREVTVKEVQILRRVELPASDYEKIKKFYDELPSKMRQRIVIRKDEPAKK